MRNKNTLALKMVNEICMLLKSLEVNYIILLFNRYMDRLIKMNFMKV